MVRWINHAAAVFERTYQCVILDSELRRSEFLGKPQISRPFRMAGTLFAYIDGRKLRLAMIETGLIRLGSFLAVSDPHSGWTAVTGKLDKIINAKYETLTD
jgi:hypothetical protein